MVINQGIAFFLLLAVCLHVAACSGQCVDLDVIGCRNNPHLCNDPLLAEVTCPVMCNRCPVPHTTPGATTGQSTTPNKCRNGWVSFQGSCYLFGDVASRSFTAAKSFCQQHNAMLVHINDPTENQFLQNYANTLPSDKSYWTGLTDENSTSVWRWLDDGTATTFFDWAPNEPNPNYIGENCVELQRNTHVYKWNNIYCDRPDYPLCESL